MEDFKPDTLYENRKYKRLISFYELGMGSVDRDKKLHSSSSHRVFMGHCSLVILLMAENELWMKYEVYSLIRAKRIKLYVHHNIVQGLSIIHDDRVVSLFFDCKNVEKKLNRYIFGSHLEIVDEESFVRFLSSKWWHEEEFVFFNNSTAEYMFEELIRDVNEEPRQILPPEVTDERQDGVVPENGHEFSLQPERFTDRPIGLPEESFPEFFHDAPSLPLGVPDGQRSEEPDPTSAPPVLFRDDISRAGQPESPPSREPYLVEREDPDRIIVVTDEEYKEMKKKEAEADQKKRTERLAEQKQSRPVEKRPTYRELLYGPETSSDEDELRNRVITVTIEVHADPTLPTAEDHEGEVAPPNISIRPPSPEMVIDPQPSFGIPISAPPDVSIRHPSPMIDLPPPGPETIPASAPFEVSIGPPSPIIEPPSCPETVPTSAPPGVSIRPPSPIIEPLPGPETIPTSAPPDVSIRPPSPHIELPPPVPEIGLERPMPPVEIGKRKKHKPKSVTKKRKTNPNRKKCQYATSTLKRKYNRRKPFKPYFAPLEIMDLIDWHLTEKVLNHFDVRYMYDENYKFEDLDYDDVNNILRFVELGSPHDLTLVKKYEDCVGDAAPAMRYYISGKEEMNIVDSDNESIDGVDELILWDIVRLDTEKARNSEWCRLFVQDVQRSWNAGRTSLQRGRKSRFLSIMAETMRKELGILERPRGSIARYTLEQPDIPHYISERIVPQQRGSSENTSDPRDSEMTPAVPVKAKKPSEKITTHPPNFQQVPMETDQPEVIQPPPFIPEDIPEERVPEMPPIEKDIEMPRENLEPGTVPFTNEPIHVNPEEGGEISENGGKRSRPREVLEEIPPKKRRAHPMETEPSADIPVEPSINDLISVELPAGVFTGKFLGTRVDIPCALTIEPSTTDPERPTTNGDVELRQSPVEREVVEPRIEKSAVLRNIDEIYQENEEPVHMSRLCPEDTTSKSKAAAIFHRLLFLRKDRKITLEQREDATTSNNIFIRPIN